MSLLVLMYHRARPGRHGNSPAMLDEHFAHIAKHHHPVMPGDPLSPGAINVCLSFDDGYFDFYATVFPLLRKHGLRALLAIPPQMIMDRVETEAADRSNVEIDDAFAQPAKGGFCTWGELTEMARSGHVTMAAHGYSHRRLDAAEADLGREIDGPQDILRAKLDQPIDSFVFPYGRFSEESRRQAHNRYRHVFRIGGAANRGWTGRMLYRIDADELTSPVAIFAPGRLLRYRARYFWNQLRGK